MSDYSIPVTIMHGPRSVAASRTRGLRAVAFGVALMLVAQTWSSHCATDQAPPQPTSDGAGAPAAGQPTPPRAAGVGAPEDAAAHAR
ncbi:MAG: hypothetical protein AB7O97_14455 [Planctomycetota bacterium]